MLVATPIGNLGDISSRAIRALSEADAILCEDTRVSAFLLRHLGISKKLVALHDHNESAMIAQILARMGTGDCYALISDAGTPLVSDPGFRLARAAIAAGFNVSAIPGPNAALLALTLSGLPPQPFLFYGFLPPKSAARTEALTKLRAACADGVLATLIFYEAPHRLCDTLTDAAHIFPGADAAVARELTKIFEEIKRGTVEELLTYFTVHKPRGEITLLIAPKAQAPASDSDVTGMLRTALATHRMREAVDLVAASTGMARKQVYALALALRVPEG
jgi:16S rRNA (cytidine1402-2'-O)-methyltransferase